MLNAEQSFHKSRVAFMIINNKILYLSDSKMSHKEWYDSLNLPEDLFDNVVRGYFRDDRIIYYKGDFLYDEDVIVIAMATYKTIMRDLNVEEANVYCGVTKGEIGTPWPPTYQLKIQR